MRLAGLPGARTVRVRETVGFSGLCRPDEAREGELVAAVNLSLRQYPQLAPRLPRTVVSGYESPTALYSWNGKLVVADGSTLRYDGETLCNVTPGEKQFAVVNTKLIVFPDKLMVDLHSHSVTKMDASVTSTGSNAVISGNTLAIPERPVFQTVSVNLIGACDFKVYGDDPAELVWNEAKTALTSPVGTTYINGNWGLVGKIFLPSVTYSAQSGAYSFGFPVYGEAENELGFYAVVTAASYDSVTQKNTITFDVYWKQRENGSLEDTFRPGDAVNVTGSVLPFHNVTGAKLAAVEEGVLTFPAGTFTAPSRYHVFNAAFEGNGYLYASPAYYRFQNLTAKPGDILLLMTLGESPSAKLYHAEDGSFSDAGVIYAVSAPSPLNLWTELSSVAYGAETLTLTRAIPDLDFICASQNRLWGVSNAQESRVWDAEAESYRTVKSRVIWASALGEPMKFYDFSGISTDSYAVAEASEGDFSACCAYATEVLFFKRNRIVKLVGGEPCAYSLYNMDAPGAVSGASCAILEEVLYYKGEDGVYAYTGGTPVCVSRALSELSGGAASGAVGTRYYLAHAQGLFCYDAARRLWTREDDFAPLCFADCGGTLFAADGSAVYALERSSGDGVSWQATFASFQEGTVKKKSWTRLILRAELSETASLTVQTKLPGDVFRVQKTVTGGGMRTILVPLPNVRADSLTLRLSGTGAGRVLGLAREFLIGSEL